jgi:VanZ family protein
MRVSLPSRRFRFALAALATLVALAATLAPVGGSTPSPVPDWALHAVGFGALAAVYALALEGRRPRVVLAGAFCLALGLGGAVELVQPVVGRNAERSDFLANAAGVGLALACYRLGHRWLRWS